MENTYTGNTRVTEPRAYIEHELLTEIFQSVPSGILAEMYNLADALFYNVMNGTAERLATECPEKQREIKIMIDEYRVIAEKRLDDVFNVLQQYASQGIWKIPDDLDIQFDQHKDVDFNLTPEDMQDVDSQLDDLRNKIIAQKEFNAVLTHLFDKKKKSIERINKIIENVAFLDAIPRSENVEDVNNTLLFVKEQIEKLKEAVATVASQDISSIPTNERSLFLRSKIDAQLKQLSENP